MTALEKAARAAADVIATTEDCGCDRRGELVVRAVLLAVREPHEANRLSPIGNAIWRQRLDAILSEPQP